VNQVACRMLPPGMTPLARSKAAADRDMEASGLCMFERAVVAEWSMDGLSQVTWDEANHMILNQVNRII
jgi:hypothetical protein